MRSRVGITASEQATKKGILEAFDGGTIDPFLEHALRAMVGVEFGPTLQARVKGKVSRAEFDDISRTDRHNGLLGEVSFFLGQGFLFAPRLGWEGITSNEASAQYDGVGAGVVLLFMLDDSKTLSFHVWNHPRDYDLALGRTDTFRSFGLAYEIESSETVGIEFSLDHIVNDSTEPESEYVTTSGELCIALRF